MTQRAAFNTVLSWSQEPTTRPSLLSHLQQTWTIDRNGSCLSYRDDEHVPQDLTPQWRARGTHEQYPSTRGTFAIAPEKGFYICSQITGARIPQTPPLRDFRERLRIDYRFGPHDHMQYPQFWKECAPHLGWIERVETHRQLYKSNIVGYVLQQSDWTTTHEGGMYGKVCSPVLERLREAFLTIRLLCIPLLGGVRTRHPLARIDEVVADCTQLLSDLDVLASTYREAAVSVARIQRGIAELRAVRLFLLDVHQHMGDKDFVSNRMFDMVGVFTLDLTIYDLLYRLGVPVWLVVKVLPTGVTMSEVMNAIPWERTIEQTPLDVTPYTLDSRGRRQRSRYDLSPPRYAPEPAFSTSERDTRRFRAPRGREARVRSLSPRRENGGARVSARTVPRYILHEDCRRNGSTKHPDAPRGWIPRSFITDPGHQADSASLPSWIPICPEWLQGVAAAVDCGIKREWLLCTVADPVPQWPFLEKQTHALPPFHLFVKSENRLRFIFPMWVAFRDFWLGRLLRGECDGLEAGLWRKVVDGKYFMQSSLLEWIRSKAPKPTPQPDLVVFGISDRAGGREGAGGNAEIANQERSGGVEGMDAAFTRERVRVLSEQVEAALEANEVPGGQLRHEDREWHEEDASDDCGEEEGEVGPDADPVYGFHEPPATAHDLQNFMIHRKRVDRDELANDDVRAFLIWEIQEAAFRFQVRQLDEHVLKSSLQWTAAMEKEGRVLWPKIWGGKDGFVPSGMKTPGQTDPDPRARFTCIYHFWMMVSKWPRCWEVPNLRNRTVDSGMSLPELEIIEQAVWKFYAQTFLDYFGFLPTIPTCMPHNPFIE